MLERDELSLNHLLIPFVPAEAGTLFFGRVECTLLVRHRTRDRLRLGSAAQQSPVCG